LSLGRDVQIRPQMDPGADCPRSRQSRFGLRTLLKIIDIPRVSSGTVASKGRVDEGRGSPNEEVYAADNQCREGKKGWMEARHLAIAQKVEQSRLLETL
jgi:hypothetical protein